MLGKGHQHIFDLTHSWGQYSPFYSVSSKIPWETPENCNISFAQILSRHGARYPTSKMSSVYNSTIRVLQNNVKNLQGDFRFLSNYSYDLNTDQLTDFGRREMLKSGMAFYERYQDLAAHIEPFVRASASDRVVESADLFLTGFYHAQQALNSSTQKGSPSLVPKSDHYQPLHPMLIIPESPSSNNT